MVGVTCCGWFVLFDMLFIVFEVSCRLFCFCFFFFFKQKTAYEIGTGDWSSDVCSSDLAVLEFNELPLLLLGLSSSHILNFASSSWAVKI